MTKISAADPCIPYGRGGAGNMRRRSSIVDAWSKIAARPAPANKLILTSSPESHYANSKSEPRTSSLSSSSQHRRASSLWSSSTAGENKKFRWKTLFRGRSSNKTKEEAVKIEEPE